MGGDPGALRGARGSNSNFTQSKDFTNKSCQLHCKGDKNVHIVTLWPLGSQRGGGTWGSAEGQPQSSSNRKFLLTKVVRHSLGMNKIPTLEGSPTVWSHGCHEYFLVTYKTNLAVWGIFWLMGILHKPFASLDSRSIYNSGHLSFSALKI